MEEETLRLRAISRSGDGPDVCKWEGIVNYEVLGLAPGEQGWIGQTDNHWQILRANNGVQGNWTGSYNSAEDALVALQAEVDSQLQLGRRPNTPAR